MRKSVTEEFGAEHMMYFEFSQVHSDHCVEMRMKGTGATSRRPVRELRLPRVMEWHLLVFLRTSRC